MGQMKMIAQGTIKTLALTLAVFAALVFAPQHFPVGTRTYPGARSAESSNIPISAPRYIIPRELVFPKNIGTAFGLLPYPDPHFTATAPVFFDVAEPSGQIAVTAQGFDINHRFEREELRQSILALRVDERIFRFDAGNTCFRCWGDTRQLFFLGHSDDMIAFVVQRPAMASQALGILTVGWPPETRATAKLTLDGTREFESIASKFATSGVSELEVKALCGAQSISISRFVLQHLGVSCSQPDF